MCTILLCVCVCARARARVCVCTLEGDLACQIAVQTASYKMPHTPRASSPYPQPSLPQKASAAQSMYAALVRSSIAVRATCRDTVALFLFPLSSPLSLSSPPCCTTASCRSGTAQTAIKKNYGRVAIEKRRRWAELHFNKAAKTA